MIVVNLACKKTWAGCWCEMHSSSKLDTNQAISCARKHGPAAGCWCEIQSSAGHDTGQAISCAREYGVRCRAQQDMTQDKQSDVQENTGRLSIVGAELSRT